MQTNKARLAPKIEPNRPTFSDACKFLSGHWDDERARPPRQSHHPRIIRDYLSAKRAGRGASL